VRKNLRAPVTVIITLAMLATPFVAAGESTRAPSQQQSQVSSSPAIAGSVVPTAVYGLAFGRPPAIVPPTAAQSGVVSAGPWLVDAINVSVGDSVTTGQTLATADTAALQLQLSAAQAAVDAAQAKLNTDTAYPTRNDIANADAALRAAVFAANAARQAVADTFHLDSASVHGAKKNMRIQEAALRSARATGQPPASISAAARAIAMARVALQNAKAGAGASNDRAQQAAGAARAALVLARAAHARAVAPSSDSVLAADQSALASANLNLSKANDALTGAQITSPVDGVVASILISQGAVAGIGDAIQVVQPPMQVIAHVPEALINSIKLGQPMTVTVPASSATVDGTVLTISSKPDSGPGAPVTYPVMITLISPPDGLRLGMTASIAVQSP
jgi:multidrug resistance efflux pump